MNKLEVVQILSYLSSNNYSELTKKTEDQKQIMIQAWLDCLKNYDYNTVLKAVKELMTRNIFMPKLVEIIELSKEYKQAKANNILQLEEGKCLKCNGSGIIPYVKQINGMPYTYVAHCTCTAGQAHAYNGRNMQDERRKSNYYIPSISEVLGGVVNG